MEPHLPRFIRSPASLILSLQISTDATLSMDLEFVHLKHPRAKADKAVGTCPKCRDDTKSPDTPSSSAPGEESFPKEGEIRWGVISVHDPFVKLFNFDIQIDGGKPRPCVIVRSDEGYRKCVVALCATFTRRDGEPGLKSMPELARFFCIQVAQILISGPCRSDFSPFNSRCLNVDAR